MDLDAILLVDDDPTNLAVLRETLKGQDYRLLMAKSGEQALSVASKARPALVLLDVMMPGIDGFETCERLKADPETADSAVIFLSALDDAKDKVRGLELGAVDFISKPFDPQEVIARVDTHLTIRRLERSLLRKNRELEEVNNRMRMDLEAAARVQQSFLPKSMPEVTGARFDWRYRPCEELAGDYLNVAVLDEHRVGMFVVDVCGHGVPSSLLTVTVARNLNASPGGASVLSSVDDAGQVSIASPAEVAGRLNALYPMSANANLYFTFLYGVLNVETHEFRFVSAGNPGPVVARSGGAVEVHDAPAVPIGLLPESEYEDTVLQLGPGDRLYLFSDGLLEERNDDGEILGQERVMGTIGAQAGAGLEASLDALVGEVVRWRGSEKLHDDVAVVAAEVASSRG
jgi:sigma-B regulation protein RsbU (phosphoserine phosphatase)